MVFSYSSLNRLRQQVRLIEMMNSRNFLQIISIGRKHDFSILKLYSTGDQVVPVEKIKLCFLKCFDKSNKCKFQENGNMATSLY